MLYDKYEGLTKKGQELSDCIEGFVTKMIKEYGWKDVKLRDIETIISRTLQKVIAEETMNRAFDNIEKESE